MIDKIENADIFGNSRNKDKNSLISIMYKEDKLCFQLQNGLDLFDQFIHIILHGGRE